MRKFFLALFAIIISLSAYNQSTFGWNFGTDAANANPSSGTPVPGLTISGVSQGNNNGTTTLLTTTSASGTYAGASGQFNAGAAARVGTLNTAATGSAYFEFTLTPDAGKTVSITNINFGSRSTGTGPQAYTIRTSLDGFASDAATATLPTTSVWALYNNSVSIASGSGAGVTIRVYGYNGAGTPVAGTANWRIDDLSVTVNVSGGGGNPTASVGAGNNMAEPATNGIFNINLSAPAPVGGVTINYTLSGSAILNTEYTDPGNGTITIAQGNNSATITLNVNNDNAVQGTKIITVTLNNATNNFEIATASASISRLDDDVAPAAPVVINEVYGGGGNTGAPFTHDYVELYNNSSNPVVMNSWSIQYTSAAGTTWSSQKTTFSGTIGARGYFLVQMAGGAIGVALPTADATGSTNMSATAGKLVLCNNSTNVSAVANPTDANIIDKVGYGSTATGFETAPATAPSNSNSIQRLLNIATLVAQDTDNNSVDFAAGVPSPKNSINDLVGPTISSLLPANGATNVASSQTATITFNENIKKGSGNILVKRTSDNSIVQTIDVTNASVIISGATASFSLTDLAANTGYYIEIAPGAIKDLADNNFAGISGNTTWAFTTGSLLYVANFNACSSSLTEGFTQFSIIGPQLWACTSFGRDANNLPAGSAPNGVQINGFNTTNIPNEDWLISPSFNLTGTTFPLLSFWSRTAFNGEPLQLKVSTDYVSGDPLLATWVDLNGKFPGETSNIWTLSENINLSAFKGANVHFAFVYYSSDDDGARWTLDDIALNNSSTPPPPSLTVSTSGIQFPYTAAGNTSVKAFTFIGNDLTNNITLNATGPFSISKDNASFNNSLSYTIAEANNLLKTVYVRFTPPVNKQNFTGNILIQTGSLSANVALSGTSIDPATTLEVVNWNIEWFGSTTNGPTNDAQQEQNVKTILQNLNADIYAVSEIVSEARLASVVSQMPGYSYVISNYGSHTNTTVNPPSALAEAQKLAFIYKTSVFSKVSTQALLTQGINSAADLTNPAYDYWASGRFPFMLSADVTLNCITKNVKFILVHAKANTSPTATSYERRRKGADTLHYTLQLNYPNDNIVILGDYNDDLDESITDGFTITSWSSFTNDAANYEALTLPLSLAGEKSTVSHDDVIDHVTVSTEMEQYYISATADILTDAATLVSNYGSSTSDHYPVFTRYIFNNNIAPGVTNCTGSTSFCQNNTNTYAVPAFVASDDCGDVVTYNYSITGATTRNGNTNNASGTFNVGVSVIRWTATDGWGNTTTCQTTVTVNTNPTVTIPDAFALPSGTLANTVYIGYASASSIMLTASPSGSVADYSYSWSNGSTSSTAMVSPTVNTNYTVTVTDQNGCQGSASKFISVIDIRGGNKNDKVKICHNSNSIVVDGNSITGHLAHGDMLGACTPPSGAITRSNNLMERIIKENIAVHVLPNPSSKNFTLNVVADINAPIVLRIIDVSGRIIERKNLTSGQSITIGDNYQAGIYSAEIMKGGERKVVKLVKIQ